MKAAKVPDIAADINAEAAANEGTAVPKVSWKHSKRKSAERAEAENEGGKGKSGIDRKSKRQFQRCGRSEDRQQLRRKRRGLGSERKIRRRQW